MEKEKILVEVKQFERELQMQNKVLAALNTVDDVKLVVIENELLDMFKKKLNMKLKAWGIHEGVADSYININWSEKVLSMSLDKQKIKRRIGIGKKKRFDFDAYSLDEVMMIVKKEIIRQGIEDNPSQNLYYKNLKVGSAPTPPAIQRKYGMNWNDVLGYIGIEPTPLKTYKDTDEILRELRAEIERLNMKYPFRKNEYEEKRDKENSPSSTTAIVRTGKGWREIIDEIMN